MLLTRPVSRNHVVGRNCRGNHLGSRRMESIGGLGEGAVCRGRRCRIGRNTRGGRGGGGLRRRRSNSLACAMIVLCNRCVGADAVLQRAYSGCELLGVPRGCVSGLCLQRVVLNSSRRPDCRGRAQKREEGHRFFAGGNSQKWQRVPRLFTAGFSVPSIRGPGVQLHVRAVCRGCTNSQGQLTRHTQARVGMLACRPWHSLAR